MTTTDKLAQALRELIRHMDEHDDSNGEPDCPTCMAVIAGHAALAEYDSAPSAPAGDSAVASELSEEAVNYPRDIFNTLIVENSPYAFYLFQWVPYQTEARRWRLKMHHDVLTFDGREAHGVWPNGSHCGPFRDDEVEFIRISRKQWGEEWADPRPSPEAQRDS